MARSRYNLIPAPIWPYLGPAFKGIDQDLSALESSGGGGTGGGVSSWNDLTDKPTLAAVATSGAYADLTGKPAIPDVTTLAPKASPTFTGTVSGISKAMVGLGNVDNTADANKTFTAAQTTSGVFNPARLGTGTPDATKFLAGDGTWKTAPSGGVGGDVAPSNLQNSLGLTASGSTATTASIYDGYSATWELTDDTVPFVFGTRFTANAAGQVNAVRFYLTGRWYDGQTITGGLVADNGTVIETGTRTITSADPVGWVTINLTTPVTVTKDTAYKAAVLFPLGNDGKQHSASVWAGWDSYAVTSGPILAAGAGGNGWYAYNPAQFVAPDVSDTANRKTYAVDVILTTTQPSSSGVRMPVVAYYHDENATTIARPTDDPLVAVLWFNTDGTEMPSAAIANIDKVWTV